MPAPAVIPALKVYINTVVVKTPVVNQRVIVIDLTSSVRHSQPRIVVDWMNKDRSSVSNGSERVRPSSIRHGIGQ